MRASSSLLPCIFVAAAPFACGGSGDDGPTKTTVAQPHSPGNGAGGDGQGSQPVEGAQSEGADPGPPAVQLVGRFDTRDPSGAKCAWPGCRIVARFEGTHVSVRLREEVEPWMDGAPSEWDVAVDGTLRAKIVTARDGAPTDYPIADGLAAGAHVVELYKRSEAQNGTTQFLGYDFHGGTLLPPPARKARRIEIIGDSASSGFGVEGVGLGPDCPGPDYAARYQNFHKSFGARLGEILDSEVAGTVQSGKGIMRNVSSDDDETMPLLFLRSIPGDATSTWDFGLFASDVVIVMLGGNDFEIGYPVDHGPPTLAAFISAYEAFVAQLRAKYPAAHVFLTVSPTISDEAPAGRATRTNVSQAVNAVAAQRSAASDRKVYAFEPAVATGDERTGCEGHGNPQFHERVAKELAAQIKGKTGW